ncbi:MAG: NAD(P)-dependent oxidoreductase [Alphaproteobacteria bacterium]|nr:NAD(P)-dependent oxidoreductase [Alphaproteobacteria bacterium]
MKIAVLNECFLSPKNLDDLRAMGEVSVFNDTTSEDLACERMQGRDIVLADAFECPLNEKTFEAADMLKLICLNSTGFDRVDLSAAKRKKILVANAPGYSTEAVAEHAFALILSLSKRICLADRDVRKSPFQVTPSDRTHDRYIGFNLSGKILGIYGTGAIGQQVARIANGFGMTVIGYNRSPKTCSGIKSVSLDELLAQSDILTLHAPFNAESKNFIKKRTLERMKDRAIIINTAREGCLVISDLAMALKSGKIGGAGLDVVGDWSLANPIFEAPNTVLTPHSAWYTSEALENLGNVMTENVKFFVAGNPKNIVPFAD